MIRYIRTYVSMYPFLGIESLPGFPPNKFFVINLNGESSKRTDRKKLVCKWNNYELIKWDYYQENFTVLGDEVPAVVRDRVLA